MIYCSECGFENHPDTDLCANCGLRIWRPKVAVTDPTFPAVETPSVEAKAPEKPYHPDTGFRLLLSLFLAISVVAAAFPWTATETGPMTLSDLYASPGSLPDSATGYISGILSTLLPIYPAAILAGVLGVLLGRKVSTLTTLMHLGTGVVLILWIVSMATSEHPVTSYVGSLLALLAITFGAAAKIA